MEKKRIYIEPTTETLLYTVQNLMKVGSDLPDDPPLTPAPAHSQHHVKVF